MRDDVQQVTPPTVPPPQPIIRSWNDALQTVNDIQHRHHGGFSDAMNMGNETVPAMLGTPSRCEQRCNITDGSCQQERSGCTPKTSQQTPEIIERRWRQPTLEQIFSPTPKLRQSSATSQRLVDAKQIMSTSSSPKSIRYGSEEVLLPTDCWGQSTCVWLDIAIPVWGYLAAVSFMQGRKEHEAVAISIQTNKIICCEPALFACVSHMLRHRDINAVRETAARLPKCIKKIVLPPLFNAESPNLERQLCCSRPDETGTNGNNNPNPGRNRVLRVRSEPVGIAIAHSPGVSESIWRAAIACKKPQLDAPTSIQHSSAYSKAMAEDGGVNAPVIAVLFRVHNGHLSSKTGCRRPSEQQPRTSSSMVLPGISTPASTIEHNAIQGATQTSPCTTCDAETHTSLVCGLATWGHKWIAHVPLGMELDIQQDAGVTRRLPERLPSTRDHQHESLLGRQFISNGSPISGYRSNVNTSATPPAADAELHDGPYKWILTGVTADIHNRGWLLVRGRSVLFLPVPSEVIATLCVDEVVRASLRRRQQRQQRRGSEMKKGRSSPQKRTRLGSEDTTDQDVTDSDVVIVEKNDDTVLPSCDQADAEAGPVHIGTESNHQICDRESFLLDTPDVSALCVTLAVFDWIDDDGKVAALPRQAWPEPSGRDFLYVATDRGVVVLRRSTGTRLWQWETRHRRFVFPAATLLASFSRYPSLLIPTQNSKDSDRSGDGDYDSHLDADGPHAESAAASSDEARYVTALYQLCCSVEMERRQVNPLFDYIPYHRQRPLVAIPPRRHSLQYHQQLQTQQKVPVRTSDLCRDPRNLLLIHSCFRNGERPPGDVFMYPSGCRVSLIEACQPTRSASPIMSSPSSSVNAVRTASTRTIQAVICEDRNARGSTQNGPLRSTPLWVAVDQAPAGQLQCCVDAGGRFYSIHLHHTHQKITSIRRRNSKKLSPGQDDGAAAQDIRSTTTPQAKAVSLQQNAFCLRVDPAVLTFENQHGTAFE